MSFYDDASLIMYPSGYKEDKIYSLKPTDGSGDLTFTRASTATRVNSEGLIETPSVLGSEQVTNGDFDTDSDWTKGTGWSIDSGLASQSGGAGQLSQTGVLTAGKTYSVSVVINSINSGGQLNIALGSGGQTLTFTESGTKKGVAAANEILYLLGNATFIGSISSVSVKEVITNNVPRIDYTGGGCGKLLLEPQRTNILLRSSEFDNAYWAKNAGAISANAAISPDGDTNAEKLIAVSLTTQQWAYRLSLNVVINNSYTVSIFAKKEEYDYVQLRLLTNINLNAVFNLDSGTVHAQTSGNAKIEDYGNGWYRCSVSGVATSTGNAENYINLSTSGAGQQSFLGDGTSGVYIWGAQLEQGSYATSYIPTSGATVTRTQDTSSTTGLSSVINSEEGVFYFEGSILDFATSNSWISISEDANVNANQFNLRYVASSNLIQAVSRAGGLGQDVVLQYTLTDKTALNKIAIKYKVNDWALWVNGVEVDTETSSTPFTANSLDVLDFNRGNNSNPFYGKCQNLMVFPSALTDDELADLTGEVHQTFNSLATFYGYTIL